MSVNAFPTRIDLPAERREKLIGILNQHLADTIDLHSQTKYAHWNVKGPNFISLHKLFDELAETLDEAVDMIAERGTALGGIAHGTLRQGASRSRLPEFPADVFADLAVVDALAARFANLAKTTREAIDTSDELGDKSTADLFTEVSRDLDKSLWFLEAHLQKRA